jgi:hypothetical protein
MPRTVIDADGHVGEPKEPFERYLDVPLGGRRLHRWKVSGGGELIHTVRVTLPEEAALPMLHSAIWI